MNCISVTHIITIRKSVHENSPKMSTRIHQNNVHEKSPQKRNSSGQKCPQEFLKSVHENSPILSTRIRLLCPLEFFHPFETWSIKIISCIHLDNYLYVFAFNILRFLLQELKRKKHTKENHLFLFPIRILWISKLNLCNSDKIFHCGIRMRCYYCIIKVTEKKIPAGRGVSASTSNLRIVKIHHSWF